MLGGNGLQQTLQFLTFILLARYLSPADFGYVALAGGVVEILSALGRWGIGDVILQRRRSSSRFLAHAFVLAVGIGATLVAGLMISVLIYVALYGWTLTAKLLLLLAPTVLLQAIEMVPETVLRQRLNYKWLAMRNNAAALVAGLVALLLAMNEQGVYALAAQRLLWIATLLAMVWIAAGDSIRLLPWHRYHGRLLRGILGVGTHLVSSQLSGLFGSRMTDILVGSIINPVALGQLKIARRIYDFVAELSISPLANVAQAVLPQLMRDTVELRKVYSRIQGACALGVFPVLAGLGLTASMWVPLVLGPHWNDAVILIQLICLAGIPAVVNWFQMPLLIAFRRNRLVAGQNIARVVCSLALTAIALPFGVEAVVAASIVQGYAFMVFNWVMIRQITGWRIIDNIDNLLPPFVGATVMIAVVTAYQHLRPPPTGWLSLMLTCAAGALIYCLVQLLVFRSRTLTLVREATGLLRYRKA